MARLTKYFSLLMLIKRYINRIQKHLDTQGQGISITELNCNYDSSTYIANLSSNINISNPRCCPAAVAA